MGKSCKDIARTLLDCMAETQCVQQGQDVKECMKTMEGEDRCGQLRRAYFECKRGSLDMRYRIRGPKVY
ncbi:hypothetical protein EON65_46430 [archaeon]|nr:MAG: hypothetical protein EON65_46430 [archaeon]